MRIDFVTLKDRGEFDLARILHEAFTCERRKHGIFGSILEVRARTFRTFTALATKFRAICGLRHQNKVLLSACGHIDHGRAFAPRGIFQGRLKI